MNVLSWFRKDQVRLSTEEQGCNMETVDELLREYQRSCTPEQMGKMLEKIQSQNSVQHKLVQKLLFERNHILRINKEISMKNSELERLVERQRCEINRMKQETGYGQTGYGGFGYGGDRATYNGGDDMINWQTGVDPSRMANQRIQDLKRKKLQKVYVYLYSPQREQIPPVSDITSRIGEELLQRDIELIPETIDETPVPEQARPAILLCVNVSRLGTDVSNALKDVRASEDVAVVVLHHKDVHVLPKLSSEKSLTGAEFQELGAIVDMAFWKEKGLHQCDINQTAIMKLADFLADYAIA
ncbi:uncharacterized protein LOC124151119 [Haliotis rufescens]|uniref:uncharacterized protein LOC124151119 n=1 Tax=Haliotis rufescens TaxID=6454 RepID=UPI00201FB0A2|nr:uncharacterized protein LOC124151119 [Haliotis rufescens]XP_046379401.2 uncharacterized protein LOC124151119 [Haliotis rufescens]